MNYYRRIAALFAHGESPDLRSEANSDKKTSFSANSIFFDTRKILLPKDFRKKWKQIFNRSFFHFLAQFLFLVLLSQVLLLIAVVFLLRSEYRQKMEQFVLREQERVYWARIAEQYPNAPDVLYNAALSTKNIGNEKEAIFYLEKAIKLDPLFMEARLLRKALN